MKGLRKDRSLRELERRLRAEAPSPSRTLLTRFAPSRRTRPQFALAGALTAMLLVALSAVGGVSYAATSVAHAVKVAAKAVAPAASHQAVTIKGISAGGDQYRPGYGFGDKNHEHTGPPGLSSGNGAKTPPAQVKKDRAGRTIVKTVLNVDEQAALYFSVVDADGNKLLLNQQGSHIGGGKVSGKQVKSLHYVVLVPRTIPISLEIPANLLKAGETYKLHVIAVDADGNKSELDIPFSG